VFDHLEALLGSPFDREEVSLRRRQRFLDLTSELLVMPGVVELLDQAHNEQIPCAIASSSESHWVNGYIDRFGIAHRFAHVVTRDQVARPKPAPDLYTEACRRLGVAPSDALAIEDSTNGVRAAKDAGLRCVAVPNSITRSFDFSHADLILETLSGLKLSSLASSL
jgi:HAD superfamily hydrolase (TIGR01509 family)